MNTNAQKRQVNLETSSGSDAMKELKLNVLGFPASIAENIVGAFTRQSPAACFIKDENSHYVFVNEKFESSYNVTSAQLLGKTDECWLPQATAEQLMKNDRAVLAAGQAKEFVETIITGDEKRDWLVWKFPCTYGDGQQMLGGVAFDISAFQSNDSHLRDKSELLELILNNIGDPVIAVDTSGKLLLFNPAAFRLYGMGILGTSQTKKTDRFGLFLADGTTPFPKEELPLAKAARGEAVSDQEIFVRTPDAPAGVYLSAKAQPILDTGGSLKGGAAVFRDITARKLAEEKLQLMVRQLEEARDEAVRASELKSQFVSNISHELRTPMSGILGMTELLLGMTIDPEQKELATYVYESAQSLLLVLNELLDFSKLEAGKLNLEATCFSVSHLLETVAGAFTTPAERKNIKVSWSVEPNVPSSVLGDMRRIKEVLQHLMQNAVKFTEKGEIKIGADVENSSDDLVILRLTVTDTGIGISEGALNHIFAPFVQADGSNTRKYGGVGLGLSIAQRLIKLMNGTMGADSKIGKGTTFWVDIPLSSKEVAECNLTPPQE